MIIPQESTRGGCRRERSRGDPRARSGLYSSDPCLNALSWPGPSSIARWRAYVRGRPARELCFKEFKRKEHILLFFRKLNMESTPRNYSMVNLGERSSLRLPLGN